MIQTSTSVVMLLLLLTVMAKVGSSQMAPAAVKDQSAARWGRHSPSRQNRGFRLGGADRVSHGFGRRRRGDELKVISPLL